MTPTLSTALPDLGAGAASAQEEAGAQVSAVSAALLKIPVSFQVVIGSARIPLAQVSQLGPGSVLTLDQKLGAPAVILVNGREVAKGELFVLDAEGDRLGITITEIAGSAPATG